MSVFRRAAEFLGLVDDEAAGYPLDDGFPDEYAADADYADYDDEQYETAPARPRASARAVASRAATEPVVRPMRPVGERGERSESPSGAVTVTRGARTEPTVVPQSASSRGVAPVARAVPAAARVHVIEPRSFNDAQEIGDRMKDAQPVIMNLQDVDRELQRRLIDFASGLCYALDGTMSKAADHVFLLTPRNVDVSDDEVEQLSARGLYRAR
jgi:cell division inhibitor SepF